MARTIGPQGWAPKHLEVVRHGADTIREFCDRDSFQPLWLVGADLQEAQLQGAELLGAHLENSNLQDANLSGAILMGAHLEGADLEVARLECAQLADAHLEGASLRAAHLEGANLEKAYLERADLGGAHLENADLQEAHLRDAWLWGAQLQGANLWGAHLEGADFESAVLDDKSLLGGTGPSWWMPGRLLWLSNYGGSSIRLVVCFVVLSLIFAVIYLMQTPAPVDAWWPTWDWNGHKLIEKLEVYKNGNEYSVERKDGSVYSPMMTSFRAAYFSIVTMTTLGFGDLNAHPGSIPGYTLVMLHVICGYVLLGALITRLATLFQSVE